MKRTTSNKQRKPPVFHPQIFRVRDLDQPGPIRHATRKHRPVSADQVAVGLEQLATEAAADTPLGSMAKFQLFDLITAAVGRMNQLARKHSEQWRDLAGFQLYWPVYYNKTPLFRQRADELLEMLGVGEQVFPRPHSKSRLNPIAHPTERVALQLLDFIDRARRRGILSPFPLPPGWRQEAMRLQYPVDKADRAKWRKVAEQVLSEAGYNAAQFASEPGAECEAKFRKDSYRRMKFWQVFDQLLKEYGKRGVVTS